MRLVLWGAAALPALAAQVIDTDRDAAVQEEINDYCKQLDSGANDIVRENCRLDGVLASSFWDVNAAGDPSIQGFAKPYSALPGNAVDFRVKTRDLKLNAKGYDPEHLQRAFRVDIFRMGFYRGKGARLVATLRPSEKEMLASSSQPECYVEPETHLVDCATWAVSSRWQVPENATSGVYLARFVREWEQGPKKQEFDYESLHGPDELISSSRTHGVTDGSNWRTDASPIHVSPKFGNPDLPETQAPWEWQAWDEQDTERGEMGVEELEEGEELSEGDRIKVVNPKVLAKYPRLGDGVVGSVLGMSEDGAKVRVEVGGQVYKLKPKWLQKQSSVHKMECTEGECVGSSAGASGSGSGSGSRSAGGGAFLQRKLLSNAYGAQRRARGRGAMLQTALLEPRASIALFVVRQAVRARGARGGGSNSNTKHRHRPPSEIVLQTIDTTAQAYNSYLAPSSYGTMPLGHHGHADAIAERMELLQELAEEVEAHRAQAPAGGNGSVDLGAGAGVSSHLRSVLERAAADARLGGYSSSSSSSSKGSNGDSNGNYNDSSSGGYVLPAHLLRHAPTRAHKLSYNRPLLTRDYRAVNTFFHAELPAIRFLESNGYDVSYVSGLDMHLGRGVLFGTDTGPAGSSPPSGGKKPAAAAPGPAPAPGPKVYISVGHDEYWSSEQRENVQALLEGRGRGGDGKGEQGEEGVNLCFLSGNEAYWNVRWETSKVKVEGDSKSEVLCDEKYGEPSTMVVYKETQNSYKLDPHPQRWTGTFRDASPLNPEGPRPENALTGTLFVANAWRHDPLLVPYRFARHRFWRHTQLSRQLRHENQTAVLLKGTLGHEWDSDLDNGFRPQGLMRLSETTVHNVQHIVDQGSVFDSGTATHHLVLRRAPPSPAAMRSRRAGKLVFGAGTVQWAHALDSFHDSVGGLPNTAENEYNTRVGVDLNAAAENGDADVRQAMVNLLADMDRTRPATLLARSYGLVYDGDDEGMRTRTGKAVAAPGAKAKISTARIVQRDPMNGRVLVELLFAAQGGAGASGAQLAAVEYMLVRDSMALDAAKADEQASIEARREKNQGYVGLALPPALSAEERDALQGTDYAAVGGELRYFLDSRWHPADARAAGEFAARVWVDVSLPIDATNGEGVEVTGFVASPVCKGLLVRYRGVDDDGHFERSDSLAPWFGVGEHICDTLASSLTKCAGKFGGEACSYELIAP